MFAFDGGVFMMRVARVVSFVLLGSLVLVARGQAQTPAAAGGDSSKFFAAFDVAATFGHKSSGAFGGEVGMRIAREFGVSIEGGHMNNVGTEDLDQRALVIGNAVGATVSASYKVNFFDAAIRYAPNMGWKAQTYVLFGVGVAAVKAETALAVNGNTVTPESLGVQFGNDLNGSVKKPLIVFGGGAMYPIQRRVFIDGSFRYGRILPKTGEIEGDKGINTARAQVGIGFTF